MKKIFEEQKIIIIMVLVCLIGTIFFKIIDFDLRNCYKNKFNRIGFTDFDVTGIIIKKYIDKRNHRFPTIKVKTTNGNEYEFILNRDQSNLYSLIELNDSIIFSKRDFNVHIINSQIDTNIVVNYNY